MKINRLIYHCLSCGTVMKAELNSGVPTCCGSKMVKAVAEAVVDLEHAVREEEPRSVVDRTSAGDSTAK